MAEASKDSDNQPAPRLLGIGRSRPVPQTNGETPPPSTTTTTTETTKSEWKNSGSGWENSDRRGFNYERNDKYNEDNSKNFGSNNQRSGYDGSRGGGHGCYNCNQPGHLARDCQEPRRERDNANHRRDNYNSDRSDRYGGGFRSSAQTEGGSISVMVKNDSRQNGGSSFNNARGPNNSFSSGGRGTTTFESSNRQDGPSNNRSAFSSGGASFQSGHRPDHSNSGDNKSYNDSSNQQDSLEENRPRPTEKYIPAAPPQTEDGIFGEATTRGVNIEKYHNAHVRCTPDGRVEPIDLFEEANFSTQIMANIRRANLQEPTAIQRYAIPCIQQKDDLMACAQTGAGKTAAFLLPIISNLLKLPDDELLARRHPPAPLCLVLSPTRELALQTEREARKFAFETPISTHSAIGGQDVRTTTDRMKDGCHILSATTGRLKDIVEKGRVQLNFVQYLVLDEADRMLDTDFMPDVEQLLTLGLPEKTKRITSMFSATFPDSIQNLAKHFLRDDYVFLAVGTIGVANEDITQIIEEVTLTEKKDRLLKLLSENLKDERCLIFVETQRSADYLGSLLSQRQFMSTTMHGARTQQQREQAVKQFTEGMCPILVATSVAARGLDFPLIGYVINYDLPDTSDFYIHRIGRTGRAGHLGKSISFFDPQRQSDVQIAPALVKQLADAGQEVPDFLRQFAAESSNSSQNYKSAREHNVDMRSSGQNFRGRGRGFGSQTYYPSGGHGGSSAAGRAQEEIW